MDNVHSFAAPQSRNSGRTIRRTSSKKNPEKLNFSGNFSQKQKSFEVTYPENQKAMRRDIFSAGMKEADVKLLDRTLDDLENKMFPSDNPTYEDPRDVIDPKPAKPPRKRCIQALGVTSPSSTGKDSKSLLRDQKKKLTKKYENLIITLMDRCEENVVLISEKEAQIAKLKDKLKSVLDYNKLFADENDQLKVNHGTLLKYIEECKLAIQELETRNKQLELRNRELGDRMKKFEVPDRDSAELTSAIPLVEVCMSCSSRQILTNQVKEHNTRLQKDMQALKDVLYRLNVQLARYQEKIRTLTKSVAADETADQFVHKPSSDVFDSLITGSLGYKHDPGSTNDADAATNKSGGDTPAGRTQSSKVGDLSGLLSAQALAPLFDAYQENLQEKEILILDYEKQFETMNKKSKQIVIDNKSLQDRVNALEEELLVLSKSSKRLSCERETTEIEKQTLTERAEKAESKLKEVYELYEDKMAAMMRDYETVHREYFAAKSALAASESKMARLDTNMRERTVPADLHERRVESCKRLLEELKHQYSMESERKAEQMAKIQEQKRVVEEKYTSLRKEYESVNEELKTALKNVRLYRKAAVIFRERMRARVASTNTLRASARRRARARAEPLQQARGQLRRIRDEIKMVKSRAYSSLEELERRIAEQEEKYRRELGRVKLILEHKDGIIRSLIDTKAKEELGLSQDVDTAESTVDFMQEQKKGEKKPVKLMPGGGGYYQEKRRQKS